MKNVTMDLRAGDLPRDELEILVFGLAGRRYALPLRDVKEVVRAVAITPLPAGPEVVEGVIDVRGALIPVMDVRRRWGWAAREVALSDCLIIARADSRTVAIRVEDVQGLVRLGRDEIESIREVAGDAEYLAGVARLPDGLALIYDLQRFLTPAEDSTLSDALRSHGSAEDAP